MKKTAPRNIIILLYNITCAFQTFEVTSSCINLLFNYGKPNKRVRIHKWVTTVFRFQKIFLKKDERMQSSSGHDHLSVQFGHQGELFLLVGWSRVMQAQSDGRTPILENWPLFADEILKLRIFETWEIDLECEIKLI